MPERLTIGIAVVEHAGRYLVGIRGDDSPLAGKAEFPGGKCREGESPVDCAVRECEEETGLVVTPVELLLERNFSYEHANVQLHFWRCRLQDESHTANNHQGFRWIPQEELASHNFPAANTPLIKLLTPHNQP